MALTTKFKQELKAKAHKLKPIIIVGNNGLTDAVNKEIDRALYDHELIKIKVGGEDRDARRAVMAAICETQQALLVQQVGNIVIVYRRSDKNK